MGPRPADTEVTRGWWVEFRGGVPLAALGGGEGVSPGLKQTEVGGWRGNLAWCPRMPQQGPCLCPPPPFAEAQKLNEMLPLRRHFAHNATRSSHPTGNDWVALLTNRWAAAGWTSVPPPPLVAIPAHPALPAQNGVSCQAPFHVPGLSASRAQERKHRASCRGSSLLAGAQ